MRRIKPGESTRGDNAPPRSEAAENETKMTEKQARRMGTLNSQALNSALVVGNFIMLKFIFYFFNRKVINFFRNEIEKRYYCRRTCEGLDDAKCTETIQDTGT